VINYYELERSLLRLQTQTELIAQGLDQGRTAIGVWEAVRIDPVKTDLVFTAQTGLIVDRLLELHGYLSGQLPHGQLRIIHARSHTADCHSMITRSQRWVSVFVQLQIGGAPRGIVCRRYRRRLLELRTTFSHNQIVHLRLPGFPVHNELESVRKQVLPHRTELLLRSPFRHFGPEIVSHIVRPLRRGNLIIVKIVSDRHQFEQVQILAHQEHRIRSAWPTTAAYPHAASRRRRRLDRNDFEFQFSGRLAECHPTG